MTTARAPPSRWAARLRNGASSVHSPRGATAPAGDGFPPFIRRDDRPPTSPPGDPIGYARTDPVIIPVIKGNKSYIGHDLTPTIHARGARRHARPTSRPSTRRPRRQVGGIKPLRGLAYSPAPPWAAPGGPSDRRAAAACHRRRGSGAAWKHLGEVGDVLAEFLAKGADRAVLAAELLVEVVPGEPQRPLQPREPVADPKKQVELARRTGEGPGGPDVDRQGVLDQVVVELAVEGDGRGP